MSFYMYIFPSPNSPNCFHVHSISIYFFVKGAHPPNTVVNFFLCVCARRLSLTLSHSLTLPFTHYSVSTHIVCYCETALEKRKKKRKFFFIFQISFPEPIHIRETSQQWYVQ